MIDMLLKYTERTRQLILLGGALILIYAVYQLAFKKTVEAYVKLQKYAEATDPTNAQQQQLTQLKQKLTLLQSQIGSSQEMEITNSKLLIESENQIADLNCKVYALPNRIEDRGEMFTYGISELILEGDFKSLVQGLNNIEKSSIGGHLVSSRFGLNENWASQKKELVLHLIFKQIKNEE